MTHVATHVMMQNVRKDCGRSADCVPIADASAFTTLLGVATDTRVGGACSVRLCLLTAATVANDSPHERHIYVAFTMRTMRAGCVRCLLSFLIRFGSARSISMMTSHARCVPTCTRVMLNEPNRKMLDLNKNNCYNYATRRLYGNWAQVGHLDPASKHDSAPLLSSIDDYHKWLIHDGLIPCAPKADDPFTNIALFVDTEHPSSFHFYRQEKDGTWTHKLGSDAPTDLDASEHTIRDPLTCDRKYIQGDDIVLNYQTFIGFFVIKDEESRCSPVYDVIASHVKHVMSAPLVSTLFGIAVGALLHYVICSLYV